MRAVTFRGAGGNEVVEVRERPDPTLGPEDVLVAVRFAGLNPADLSQREGHYPAPPGSPPDVPGLEVAGTAVAVGERVTAWRVGDRVFGLVGGGGLAERVAAHERCLARVPEAMPDAEAAGVPEAFITAHDAVMTQGALRVGETLLVHGAGGGVGSAAVQIGVGAGARVLGSVRSERAAAAARDLGAEVVPDDGFGPRVLELTGERGVDVILELVGAPHFPANFDALASQGRLLVVGVAAGDEVTIPLSSLMRRRATMRGTTLRVRPLEQKAAAVRAFEREVVPSLASGRARVLIDSTFEVGDVPAAFDRLAAPGKIGKVLLEFA
jgi:putative PIG3 family NAD(P)H quinone oxidoreductase